MSSRSRLVLLSGPGGSGTSTLAAATAAAAADEGLRATLIDVTRGEPMVEAQSVVDACLQALIGWVQPEPIILNALASLADARAVSAWHAVVTAAQADDVDLVVVDMGSLREARAMLTFLTGAELALTAMMTPALAMSRATTGDDAQDPSAGFAAVRDLHARIVGAGRLVASERTTMRLVTVPEESAVTATVRDLAVMAMLGVDVDGVIVNRCARKSDGVSSDLLDRQRAQLERVESLAEGAWCWKSTSNVRALPKDRSVLGPLGGVATLRVADLQPIVRDEDYAVLLPLVGAAARGARVGRLGDRLVVEYDGVQRWLDLPGVLRRCRAVVADRTAEGLLVSFVPDAAQWRAPDQGSAA